MHVVVVIEASLTLLYLDQYSDVQLHALVCTRSAELLVEPLLGFVFATLYMLVSAVIFCAYLYGPETGIGLSVIVLIPTLRVIRLWFSLEYFDKQSFSLARQLENEAKPQLKRALTVVGHSKLADAMKSRSPRRGKRMVARVREAHLSAVLAGGGRPVEAGEVAASEPACARTVSTPRAAEPASSQGGDTSGSARRLNHQVVPMPTTMTGLANPVILPPIQGEPSSLRSGLRG